MTSYHLISLVPKKRNPKHHLGSGGHQYDHPLWKSLEHHPVKICTLNVFRQLTCKSNVPIGNRSLMSESSLFATKSAVVVSFVVVVDVSVVTALLPEVFLPPTISLKLVLRTANIMYEHFLCSGYHIKSTGQPRLQDIE